ncbi:hypothetical protein [Umezawaea tangerina]|uniref:Uncharacterized protein n=1 Tax=Umezawaea tangerina TaxID=84725 RepID=A0A2T0T1P3_9PSEU|nr:hypothetical protein [Umezawaea tangerina]PRY39595.1 hypothetical protein CLV43_107179 [Umezawaea tangerina]
MSKRVAVVLGVAVALVAALPGAALGSTRGAAAGSPVGTATLSWSAVLVDGAGAVQTGKPLSVSWGIGDRTPRFGGVRNSGTAALTGQTYTAAVSGLLPSPVWVDACVGGTWNTTANTCSGTVTQLVTSSAGSAPAATAVPVGGQLDLRVSLTAALSGSTTASIGVSVTNGANTRAATTTNS